jgi:hypothetical protein
VTVGRRPAADRPLEVEAPDHSGRGEIELSAERIDDLGTSRRRRAFGFDHEAHRLGHTDRVVWLKL